MLDPEQLRPFRTGRIIKHAAHAAHAKHVPISLNMNQRGSQPLELLHIPVRL